VTVQESAISSESGLPCVVPSGTGCESVTSKSIVVDSPAASVRPAALEEAGS
jgi:hypothetical protein